MTESGGRLGLFLFLGLGARAAGAAIILRAFLFVILLGRAAAARRGVFLSALALGTNQRNGGKGG